MRLVLYLVLVPACRVHPLQPGPTRHTWPAPPPPTASSWPDRLCRHLAFNEQEGSTCYIPKDSFLLAQALLRTGCVCACIHVFLVLGF